MKYTRLAGLALICGTTWVVLEWLFFVTKPSFMSLHTWAEKFAILSSAALIVGLALLILVIPFMAVAALLRQLHAPGKLISAIAALPLIVFLALVAMVVLDNFTLTLFGWGIRDATGNLVYAYRVLFIVLAVCAFPSFNRVLTAVEPPSMLKPASWAAVLLLASSVPLLWIAISDSSEDHFELADHRENLPNIVILSADGISADHMSLYGYERPTTPFLDGVKEEFLIAENHFANAADTGGSVISLLSGRLPTTTRVIYPPDVLRGTDSYRHLPGILKSLGYYGADISLRHYADPFDLNMRDGFREANFRRLEETGGWLLTTIRNIPVLNPTSMMLDRIHDRAVERHEHVWKGKPMSNPLAEVNEPSRRWIYDDARIAEIQRLFDESPWPLFLHVHMMGTHGSKFRPTRRVYSTEEDYETTWHVGAYDDAIMDIDQNVEQVYQMLREHGVLNSTILVVTSDHGFRHRVLDRLPMLIRFPNAELAGTLGGNTQRLDIAPTLLGALGVGAPDWMEGVPLLDDNMSGDPQRHIFATRARKAKSADGFFWSVSSPGAPWYSMGRIFLVRCDQGFSMDLDQMKTSMKNIAGSTAICDNNLTTAQAQEIMLGHLRAKGYEWN